MHSTSSALPLLLYCSFVDALNLWRMYSRVIGVRVFLSLRGMLLLVIGMLYLVMVHPWENFIPPDLHGFYRWVFDSLEALNGLLKQVVVSRRDIGISTWVNWLREDLSSRPHA